jgi:16S rRNA (guanine527-N7)-methyltransferase
MEQILEYFPQLTDTQKKQLSLLQPLYADWNQKINVISRKDMDNFYIHHVLHSLFMTKVIDFKPGTRILDVGTGGGFPGIPLAIMFPQCHFTLLDSIAKKIKVVNEVAAGIGLENVIALQQRAELTTGKFDFIVSRAVTVLPEFMGWIGNKISDNHKNDLKNGVLYLKGGDLSSELVDLPYDYTIFDISEHFHQEFFSTKKLVHIFRKRHL